MENTGCIRQLYLCHLCCKFQTLNFDLTKNYLDLVTTYVSIMILVSKVDDRKTVLSLYNVAHEYLHGSGYVSVPSLPCYGFKRAYPHSRLNNINCSQGTSHDKNQLPVWERASSQFGPGAQSQLGEMGHVGLRLNIFIGTNFNLASD